MAVFPDVPVSNPWVDGEGVDEVDMYTRTTALLNAIQAVLPQTGVTVITIPAGQVTAVVNVVFPIPFTVPPSLVIASVMDGNGIPRTAWAHVPSATSVDLVVGFGDDNTRPFDYGGRVVWAAFP